MIATVFTMAFAIAIGLLLVIHTYMLMNNMTTLEMGALTSRNPFSRGTYRKNWEHTFGPDWKTWLVPVPAIQGTYDGYTTDIVASF
jgi:hypothetical protein